MSSCAIEHELLVIAYGNSLRRDDGAGLVLGAALAATWQAQGHLVQLYQVHQLTPELAEEIADPRFGAVLFVDAAVTGTDLPLSAPLQPLPSDDASPSLGHHLSPAVVMQYARLLYKCRIPAWLITVPATDLGHGEGLSGETNAQIEAVVAGAGDIWDTIRRGPSPTDEFLGS